ncbi:hypothetical protein GC194_04980 [bacterium]|nr:hypothetical protein [bacterium]
MKLNLISQLKSTAFGLLGLGTLPRRLRRECSDIRTETYQNSLNGINNNGAQKKLWLSRVNEYRCRMTHPIRCQIETLNAKLSKVLELEKRPFKVLLKKYAALLQKPLNEALNEIERKFNQLTYQLAYLKNKYVTRLTMLESIVRNMRHSAPSKKTFWDKSIALIIFFLGLSTIEATFSFSAIDAYFDKIWSILSWLICFGLSSSIGIGVHFFGVEYATRNYFRASIAAIMPLLVIGFIISLRSMAPNVIDVEQQIILGLANIIFYGIGLLISERVNRYRLYFNLVAELEPLPYAIDLTEHTIALKPMVIERTISDFNARAYTNTYQEIDNILEQNASINSDIGLENAKLESINDICNHWIDGGYAEFDAALESGLSKRKNLRLVSVGILTLSMLSLSSCTTDWSPVAPTKELSYIRDITESINPLCYPTTQDIYDDALARIKLNDEKLYYDGGVIIYLITIGEARRPDIKKIVLRPGTWAVFDNIHHRNEVVEAFKKEFHEEIDSFLAIPANDMKTNINSSLSYLFGVMRNDDFSSKHEVILISDGEEDDFDGIKFKAINNFTAMQDTITHQLESHAQLGDLSSFNITILSCNDANSTGLSYDYANYWMKRFQSYGAETYITSNLY